MQGRGASIGDYQAPLFFAWQLTNRCQARCLHCCEESGPDKAWKDELSREESLAITRQIVEAGVAEVAFGGGEPLSVPHVWEIFDILHKGGVGIKIETNGLDIGEKEADRLAELQTDNIQISIEGASKAAHESVRIEGRFELALAALKRLQKRKLEVEVVFVPTKLNFREAAAVYELASQVGARKFVTGPMMRLGRAALAWDALALSAQQWQSCLAELDAASKRFPDVQLACYPWDILEEIRVRGQGAQAMVLMVPNGRVKLLNALPWVCGDMRRQSIYQVWEGYKAAWKHPDVMDFIARVAKDPGLLRHANETWEIGSAQSAPKSRKMPEPSTK